MPRERQQDLQEELDAIEWKIQTTSLDLQQEKKDLIENVKQLETLLKQLQKNRSLNTKKSRTYLPNAKPLKLKRRVS